MAVYYPVFLDLSGRLCVVIGGGAVARRKVEGLLACGAAVRVIAPEADPALEELAARGALERVRRAYEPGDLAGAFLAVAATGDPEANRRVFLEARARGVPLNAVDDPDHGDVVLPAVVRRGDLTLAVSTGGRSPALARRLRERLEAEFGPEYGLWLDLLGRVRAGLRARVADPRRREEILFSLVDDPEYLALLGRGREDAALRRLEAVLGWRPPDRAPRAPSGEE